MSSVDNRIVQMQFDNAKFENGVSTSINSIEKLKQSLQFDNVGKGFDNITKAANSVDLSTIQNGIGAIEQKFSIVSEAIRRNVGKVIDNLIGKATQLANAIFVAPRTDGFKEYELKMGSVQTIMASTGATLEEVNGYLEELNTYADKTIYSFSDMTANIGKFTNAGVKLDVAVKAIQGISNEAAISGANSAEASRAMYNFAQALSSGAVKLIDWKSIENANMATVEFKQELLDTALALGTVVKDGDKYRSVTTDLSGKVSEAFTATSLFNESLAHQWMTTDVLTTTLGRYADASTELGKKAFAAAQDVKTWSQLLDTLKEAMGSGWSQSFEILIGDFNEAKELFTMISNTLGGIIDKSAKVRNGFLRMWDDKGGREKLIKQLKTILGQIDILSDKVLKNLLGSKYNKILGETNDILDDTTKKVDNLTEAEKKFVEEVWLQGLHGTGEQRAKEAADLGLSYERIQNTLDKIVTGEATIDSLAETTAESTEKTAGAVEEIKDTKWSDAFSHALTTLKFLGKSLLNIGETVLNIGKLLVQAFVEEFAIDDITYDIKNFARYLMQATGRIKDWSKDSSGILTIFRGIFKFANALWNVLSPFLTFAGKAIRQIATWLVKVGEAIDQWSNKIDENSRLYRAWNAIKTIASKVKDAFIEMIGELSGVTESNPKLKEAKEWFEKIASKVKDLLDSGLDKVVELLERLADGDISFSAVTDLIKNFGDGESKIGSFFSKLKEGLTDASTNESLFSNLKETLSLSSIKDIGVKAYVLSKTAAQGLISGLKSIDWDSVMAYTKFGVFMVIAYKVYKFVSSIGKTVDTFKSSIVGVISSIGGVFQEFQLQIKANAIKTIAESVAIFAASLFVLALLPSEKLKNVADSVGLVLITLAMLAKVLNGGLINITKKGAVKAGNISAVANINTTLLGIAGILYTMYKIFSFAATGPGWSNMLKGAAAVGILLGELAGFMLAIVLINKIAGNAAPILMKSLGKLSVAVLIMGSVISGMAAVAAAVGPSAFNDAQQAMFAIMVLMASMSALVFVKGIEKLPMVAGGLILMALAIAAVTPALAALSLVNAGKLAKVAAVLAGLFTVLAFVSSKITGKGLLNMAISLFVLGAACVYVGKNIIFAIPGFIGLAAALIVLGTIAAILSFFSAGIMTVGQALMWVAGAALIGSLAFLLVAVSIEKIANSLPHLADGCIYMAEKIKANAPLVASSIVIVLKAIIEGIASSQPEILHALGDLLDAIATFLLNPSYGVIGILLDVLEGIAKMLAKIIGRLVNILLQFLIELLYELGDKLNENKGELANATEYFVASLVNTLVTMLSAVLDGVVKGLIGVDLGLSDKVAKNITKDEEKFVRGTVKKFGTGNDFEEFRGAGEENGSRLGNAYGSAFGTSMSTSLQESALSQIDATTPEGFWKSMDILQNPTAGPIQFDKMGIVSAGSFGESFENEMKTFDFSTISSTVSNNFDMSQVMGEYGFGNSESFTYSLGEGMDEFDIESYMSDYTSDFDVHDEFYDAGEENADSFIQSIEDSRGPIRRKAIQAAAGAVDEFDSRKIDFYVAGLNAMDGFIEGIQHKMEEVHEATVEAANRVKNAFTSRDGLDEHSPSKVFMTYGEYASEGFIIGLTSYINKVSDSSSTVANTAIDALKTPLSHITDILNGTLIVDPTIRPVLDLTELQNGTGMINDMFANRSVQLAGATAKLNDFNSTMIFDAKRNQNRDVVDEMRSLRSDVNALADKMDTLQVVMDSGQLVGAISSPMDAALGQRAIRKGRRN